MNENIEHKIPLTPLTAAMEGRDEDEQFLLSSTFLSLSDPEQEILVGEQTNEAVRQWVAAGFLPESHIPAIMKLIGLLALDTDVHLPEIPQILEKLGLSIEQAAQLTINITNLLQPIFVERAANEAAETMQPLPPLTVKIPQLPENAGADTSNRHIIDLRRQPPSA